MGCSSGIEADGVLLLVMLSVNNVSGSDDGTVVSRLKTGSCSVVSCDVNDKWRVLCAGRRTVSDCGVGNGVLTSIEPGVVLVGDDVDALTSGGSATNGAVDDRNRGTEDDRPVGTLKGRCGLERKKFGVVKLK